ncbi:Potassium/sodium hyperpolarization-activated cyclic nucleotide-gated channel 1 [Phytophthora citrophthora]|uniref:Potassium/sodium hyperpolarization-activated cyclic nucleotide-gated channel 1 n=1 Tax=Phytophthora citrophthora TaxID=4793 RepID=A0AAD9LNP0_9STRA|nr:Potassium/sodium hyperpolarization-activated cyclic nucleotide-gated channel 1 [Phytophthora citrophthora]
MPGSLPPPVNAKRTSGRRRTGLFSTMNSELQLKADNHETLVQQFKIRRISGSTRAIQSEFPQIDDTNQPKADKSLLRLISYQNLRILAQQKTWIKLWKAVTSPLVPGGIVSTAHRFFMFGVNHFQILYLPFAYAFFPNGSISTIRVGMTLQLMHLVDLLLNFNTAFVRQRKLITKRRLILRNHVTKWFPLELLSAIPIGILYAWRNNFNEEIARNLLHYDALLIALRVVRATFVEKKMVLSDVLRENKQLSSWFLFSRYSNLLGIAKLMWLTVLISHYMACLWHVVAEREELETVGELYVADVYYAVQLIQGQGGLIGSWEENLLSTFIILIGSVILAIVFGNVAMLVANFNANTTKYHQKMEAVFATMEKMELPLKLRERVQQYYNHMWMEYQSLDGDIAQFQRELTDTLGLEVGLFMYMDMVGKVSFWENCSPDFAVQILLNLKFRVYLADDYVIRKGETGDEMFMINRGVCVLFDATELYKANGTENPIKTAAFPGFENLVGDKTTRSINNFLQPHGNAPLLKRIPTARLWRKAVSTGADARVLPQRNSYEIDSAQRVSIAEDQVLLRSGQVFGELSLLMNYKRTASIRAATYVEMCILSRETFQRIIARYPDDRRQVLTKMFKSCIEKKATPFPLNEIVEMETEKLRKKSASGLSGVEDLPIQVAEALVDRIDVNTPDESIKYGLQAFHPYVSQKPTEDTAKLSNNVDNYRRTGIHRARSDMNTSNERKITISESRLDELEKKIATMMNLMQVMSSSMERQETFRTSGKSCCGCCCVVQHSVELSPGEIPSQDAKIQDNDTFVSTSPAEEEPDVISESKETEKEMVEVYQSIVRHDSRRTTVRDEIEYLSQCKPRLIPLLHPAEPCTEATALRGIESYKDELQGLLEQPASPDQDKNELDSGTNKPRLPESDRASIGLDHRERQHTKHRGNRIGIASPLDSGPTSLSPYQQQFLLAIPPDKENTTQGLT